MTRPSTPTEDFLSRCSTPPLLARMSSLGWALVQAHLLRVPRPPGERIGDYFGKGDHTVESVRYSPQEATIWINRTQGFSNVPQDVWDHHIGGYQVLDKYLKSRKGRALDLDEQTHVGEIAESLAFTIKQMARIDDAYLAAFPDGITRWGRSCGRPDRAILGGESSNPGSGHGRRTG